MQIVRFSAIENFGVPIDKPNDIANSRGLINLMLAYSIAATEVSAELTDITPYYWKNPAFRYYLSRRNSDGPAVIDMMPRHNDSMTEIIGSLIPDITIHGETKKRTYEIPTNEGSMAIIGPGPRFAGQLCVHELIVPA
jgi:hypothetical protein